MMKVDIVGTVSYSEAVETGSFVPDLWSNHGFCTSGSTKVFTKEWYSFITDHFFAPSYPFQHAGSWTGAPVMNANISWLCQTCLLSSNQKVTYSLRPSAARQENE